jgi:GntR family transcriptional regulator
MYDSTAACSVAGFSGRRTPGESPEQRTSCQSYQELVELAGVIAARQALIVSLVPAIPVDPYSSKKSYLQVADDIARRIEEGDIKLKLPAERDLATEYGAAYTTIRRATLELRKRELIVTVHGRGTFVAESLQRGPDRWIAEE